LKEPRRVEFLLCVLVYLTTLCQLHTLIASNIRMMAINVRRLLKRGQLAAPEICPLDKMQRDSLSRMEWTPVPLV